MRETGKISDLIEGIYVAALEPDRWNDVVVRINEYVGGRACGLFSKDPISKSGVTHYYCGADPYYIRLYADSHSKFDPLATLPPLGQVVSIPDLVSFDEYRRGRFYQEWLRPQGCVDAANVVLEKSNSNRPVLLTVLSGKSMVNDKIRRRVALIAPHAQRALMINRTIRAKQSEAAMFADTLDGLAAGIFLVDAQCRIVYANTAARDILSTDDFLRAIDGRLVARSLPAKQRLRELFGENTSFATPNKHAMPLTAHDGEQYVAHVLPLRFVTRAADFAPKAVAALFVRRVTLSSQSYGELLAHSYGLTPTELRVLRVIVEVGGVPEVSEALGIAETTVKTHLYRVFAKTGATRQADLVKLAAGFSNPLAS
jgi:DNA-binding CsgD family transcriptional regulator/PAS domain-containing protein